MPEPARPWNATVNDAEAREEAAQRERAKGNHGGASEPSIGFGCTFMVILAAAGALALIWLMAPALDCASEGDPESYRGTTTFLSSSASDEPIERCGSR